MASVAEKVTGIRTLQSVVFDMDGVIIDSHPAHRRAWREFLLTMGKPASDQELDFVLDGRKRHEILQHFLGDVSEVELAEYGTKKDLFFRKMAFEVKPQPGALEFIAKLRREGVMLALATSAGRSRTYSTLDSLGLRETFQSVVTGDDVREGKPNAAIYSLACKELNADPANSLAIEDAESGIRAAKSAGLKCIGFVGAATEESLLAAGADRVIKNFHDISMADLQSVLD